MLRQIIIGPTSWSQKLLLNNTPNNSLQTLLLLAQPNNNNKATAVARRLFAATAATTTEKSATTSRTKSVLTLRNAILSSIVGLGILEVTTKLPSEGKSSKFYHYVSDKIMVPIMRRYCNPEQAHDIAIQLTKWGLSPTFRPNIEEQIYVSDVSIQPFLHNNNNLKNENVNNKLKFNNCIGLAAGFDKNGIIIKEMLDLGFGFIEIGSVTPQPQAGNPKPRMFRLVPDKGIINRYGFNSLGVDTVQDNLKKFRHSQNQQQSTSTSSTDTDGVVENERSNDGENSSNNKEWHEKISKMINGIVASIKGGVRIKDGCADGCNSSPGGLIGVNLGKNKTTTDENLILEDYKIGIQKLGPLADYLVINISSPNTPGLRTLQYPDKLRKLLTTCINERNNLLLSSNNDSNGKTGLLPPLLVKLAPDLSYDELKLITDVIMECNVDGIIVTNTTLQRPDTLLSSSTLSPTIKKTTTTTATTNDSSNNYDVTKETGGLSGLPIRDMSTNTIRIIYELTSGQIPIIGVGGVGNANDVYEKLKAGASLIQIYTMMIYEGPGIVSNIRKDFALLMKNHNHSSVKDIIGLDHPEIYYNKKINQLQQKEQVESSSK